MSVNRTLPAALSWAHGFAESVAFRPRLIPQPDQPAAAQAPHSVKAAAPVATPRSLPHTSHATQSTSRAAPQSRLSRSRPLVPGVGGSNVRGAPIKSRGFRRTGALKLSLTTRPLPGEESPSNHRRRLKAPPAPSEIIGQRYRRARRWRDENARMTWGWSWNLRSRCADNTGAPSRPGRTRRIRPGREDNRAPSSDCSTVAAECRPSGTGSTLP